MKRIEVNGETDDGEPFNAIVVRRRDGDEYLDSCRPGDLFPVVESMLHDGQLDSLIEHHEHLDRLWYGP